MPAHLTRDWFKRVRDGVESVVSLVSLDAGPVVRGFRANRACFQTAAGGHN